MPEPQVQVLDPSLDDNWTSKVMEIFVIVLGRKRVHMQGMQFEMYSCMLIVIYTIYVHVSADLPASSRTASMIENLLKSCSLLAILTRGIIYRPVMQRNWLCSDLTWVSSEVLQMIKWSPLHFHYIFILSKARR